MLLPRLGALLLAAKYTHALKNASPFFLLSTDPLPGDASLKSSQIALAQDLEDRLIETLSECDRKTYHFITQQHVSAQDVQLNMPKLQERIIDATKKGSVVEVPEVVPAEGVDEFSLMRRLDEVCSKKGKKRGQYMPNTPVKDGEYTFGAGELSPLPSEEEARAKMAEEADTTLDSYIAKMLKSKDSQVLMFITTPPPPASSKKQDSDIYEMDDSQAALHTDLKRNIDAHVRRQEGEDMQADLPLFEKYQFLSPPIFMGLSVTVMLLLILSVGLRAISGLDVSYAAFSKEMGPQSQKPKQQ